MAGMIGERINPVALVCGAADGPGFACAAALAETADGGLILADADEPALESAADALPNPPERVSTLAFPPGDTRRWADVIDFIATHYGRLDWAVVTAAAPPEGGLADLDTPILALDSLMGLLGENNRGGAAVLVVDARAAMKASVLHVLRTAAQAGARSNVRVNAIMYGGSDAPAWRSAARIESLDDQALSLVRRMSPPIASVVGHGLESVLPVLLSDRSHLNGATLVVDDASGL